MTAYRALVARTNPVFYGSPTIDILDTFFLFINPGTTNWYISPAQFADREQHIFDSLYVASDSASLSTIISLGICKQFIWLFGH
ncbi:hypothetical protein GT348_03765 [Aristophania vespae]|uniref:Uncharacterized protein n=1 Tax=Aristophania vespae TaxID=2697033 RepID=A0A6P1NDF3_9PROT|nr:hypothetical protein [Aristophania vespae]QHI95499.1 hypothetical protein GT348_03765 [Aristophania vespae]